MNRIEIYQRKTGMREYIAVFSDPKVIQLMGSAEVITPFYGDYPAYKVMNEIAKRNLDCVVSMKDGWEIRK